MLLIDALRYEKFAAASLSKDLSAANISASRDAEVAELKMFGNTAVIPVVGPMSYKYDFWTWYFDGTSYQGLRSQLKAADSNNQVERIVLYFDTPGGEVTGLPETARAISNMRKEVIAYVDPCCASAGLWLASQADKIVCMETGEIGSLGCQLEYRSYAEYYKRMGIDVKIFRAAISPDKNLAHSSEPLTETADKYLQERVDMWGERFVSAVAAGRKKTPEYVTEHFGQGRMLYGPEAVSVGLADSIGTFEDVLGQPTRATRKTTALHRKILHAHRSN